MKYIPDTFIYNVILIVVHSSKFGHNVQCAEGGEGGPTWVRRLVLRGKLTMHTAYERRDNACPASVTAVAAARTGRGLAVGDARGRVAY